MSKMARSTGLFFNIEISDVLSQINIELYVNKNYPDIKKIESQITEKVNGIEYIIQNELYKINH